MNFLASNESIVKTAIEIYRSDGLKSTQMVDLDSQFQVNREEVGGRRRGVVIVNGVVVGANSFVNKDIPDFAIAVGSPCRIIGYRLDKIKIEAINNSNWWNLDIEDAKKLINELVARE
jgi:hypothetical protein